MVANGSFFKLPVNLSKNMFFCVNPGVPAIFGNNQMARSGRLQWKMRKNLTHLTKAGFRIVVANGSLFKLLLKPFQKNVFFLWILESSKFLGTIRWHIVGDSNEKCPKTWQIWQKLDSGLWLSRVLCLNCFWNPFNFFLWILQSRNFWEQSDGTFWAIAMRNAQKIQHLWRKPDSGLWLPMVLCLNCFWNPFKKNVFSVNPGVPQIFGNNQMAHSGR